VAGALVDAERTPLGTRTETLERQTLVDKRLGDVQVVLVDKGAVAISNDLCVGDCRRHDLCQWLANGLWLVLQDCDNFGGLATTNEVDNTARLLRRHADVAHPSD